MLSSPAEARPRCTWTGYYWQCWNGHSWYRDYRRHHRAEIRHDKKHVRKLNRALGHDIYSGNSRQIGRDVHKLNRAHREIRQDRRGYGD
jgi:hypothetical protein